MKTKDAVIALYEQGLGGSTIAKKLNLHEQTVYYHLKKIEKLNGGRQAKTNKEEIRRLYLEEKLSCQQIADKLGLSSSAVVYNRLKNMKIKLRSKSEGMKIRGIIKIGPDKDVIQKYQSGMSQKDIAKTYNLFSGDTIRNVLNKHNINESNRGPRNPSWKGGITTLANTIRSSTQYIEFRDQHFKRTNYCSELTKNKPDTLNMHHIVGFSFILNNFTNHKEWQKCPYLWNDQNVICLSQEEHKTIHDNQKLNIDFKKFQIKKIIHQECKLFLAPFHYLKTAPHSMLRYGLFINESLVGCCTFGKGTNKSLSLKMGGPTLELTRLCLVDWLPKNTASFFLSKVIKLLKKERPDIHYLVAFADPNVGHTGSVYKASNWKFEYQCPKDYMYQLPNGEIVHKSKFRCKNGKTEKQLVQEANAIKIKCLGKFKFSYSVL